MDDKGAYSSIQGVHIGTVFQGDTAPSLKAVGVFRTARDTSALIVKMLAGHTSTVVVWSSAASQAFWMAALILVGAG